MMSDYIKPTSDIVIHYLLGSEQNMDLLLSFVNAVLEDADMPEVKSVEIKNPFNAKRYSYDKMSVLDIKAIDENGRLYDIEVQSVGNEYFANRSLYYWAKNYANQLHESENYKILNPVICINLLDFIMIEDLDSIHTCFLPIEKNNPEYVLTDHLEIHFIELPKFYQNHVKLKEKLNGWIQYFLNEGKENNNMKIILKDKTFQKAHGEYIKFTSSDEYRELIESRQKWIRDQNTLIEGAREEGEKKGERKKEIETAKKMLLDDVEISSISKYTGLSVEEIEKLKSLGLKI